MKELNRKELQSNNKDMVFVYEKSESYLLTDDELTDIKIVDFKNIDDTLGEIYLNNEQGWVPVKKDNTIVPINRIPSNFDHNKMSN